jgi:glucose-1-phosphate adenylyltransferase
MDYSLFLQYHIEKDADLTVSLLEVSKDLADQFGIAEVDKNFRISRFHEKPKKPVQGIPGDPSHVLASMGIYLFRAETLIDILKGNDDDFGRDILPAMIETHTVFAYPYRKYNRIEDYVSETSEAGDHELRIVERTRDSAYWRDVGTLDAYWNANMDLTGVNPYFNLYGQMWPVHTCQVLAPPAKFVFANERKKSR